MDYNIANIIASAELDAENRRLEHKLRMKQHDLAVENSKKLSDFELLEAIYVKLYSK